MFVFRRSRETFVNESKGLDLGQYAEPLLGGLTASQQVNEISWDPNHRQFWEYEEEVRLAFAEKSQAFSLMRPRERLAFSSIIPKRLAFSWMRPYIRVPPPDV